MPVRVCRTWWTPSRRPDIGRELAFGISAAAILLWLTFFSGPGSVEFATLAAVAAALIWFATVDPSRLVAADGRPHLVLFGLSILGCALLVTAAAVISSATTFLILAVGVAAIIVGMTRAVRHGIAGPPPD